MSFFKRLIPMKAKVWITLDKPAFQEGETVVGKVYIESNEYIRGDEVRVEARVYEHWVENVRVQRGDQWVTEQEERKDTRFSRDARISGPTDFGTGSRNFPFSVNIPPQQPSRQGGSIEYCVKGVVAVKGRPDVTGEINLSFVPPPPVIMVPASTPQGMPFTPQPTPSGPGLTPQQASAFTPQPVTAYVQSPQVVTREVVKVRCKFCNGLMDLSENRCPNCGATQ